jgi:transcriptional regulator with XRE-family HTH domain
LKNLKELRKNIGLTQIDLAKKIGVSLSTIRMWELEVARPNEENKKKLEEFFGVVKTEK